MDPPRARARSLARGAAAITLATAASRITGFLRVVVVAAALGTTFLANTYQTANSAPNVVFELLAAGVLTSIFVPTFVGYLMRGQRDEGWDAANVLTSVGLVGLTGIAILLALGAPWMMRLLTLGVADDALRQQEIDLGTTLLRWFAPQVAFYGAGMIMTAALHAHRRFAAAAIAPVFNNVVVISVYLAYTVMRGERPPAVGGITAGETLLLGLGTTMGVVAMTVALIPALSRLGWRFRFAFDLSHPAVRRGARLGAWALGYAGGYQAGLVVVLLLANKIEGGVAAYQWAYTFFYLPHALVTVPIFSVLFTAMSEHAAVRDEAGIVGRLRDGLGMLVFILVPAALALLALSGLVARATLQYGVMTEEGAELVGRVVAAFAVGLPGYSIFLVFTRAFYAVGDTRLPAVVNAVAVVVTAGLGAVLFYRLPEGWEVAGLAAGHSLGFTVGAAVLGRLFATRAGRVWSPELRRTVAATVAVGAVSLGAMVAVAGILSPASRTEVVVSLVVSGAVGAGCYGGAMWALRSPELARLAGLIKRG